MAGFVCRDPRFNKNGLKGAAYNAKEHYASLYPSEEKYQQYIGKEKKSPFYQPGNFHDPNPEAWKAAVAPIYISQNRALWLKKNRYLGNTESVDNDIFDIMSGWVEHPSMPEEKLCYALIKPKDSNEPSWPKSDQGEMRWGLFIDNKKSTLKQMVGDNLNRR